MHLALANVHTGTSRLRPRPRLFAADPRNTKDSQLEIEFLPFVCTFQRTRQTLQLSDKSCGADRDRTDDIQLAKLALSQLSYSPIGISEVGLGGLEPPTSRLSGARSNQLSYRPAKRPPVTFPRKPCRVSATCSVQRARTQNHTSQKETALLQNQTASLIGNCVTIDPMRCRNPKVS